MLITTCPECATTFRISVGILEKAGGQVRCGRCVRVFDANVDLREIDDAETEANAGPTPEHGLIPESEPQSESEPEPEPEPESESDDGEDEQPFTFTATTESPEVADIEADASAEAEAETDAEVEVEVEAEADTEAAWLEPAVPDWLRPVDRPMNVRSWRWTAGAVVLSLTLAGQLMHRFRGELVAVPALGPVLERVYSVIDIEIEAPVDLDQFSLLDLTALAEPAGEESGLLIIETRVQNKGPKVQPFPYIFVRLLDRWEDTVAGRYFGPAEYSLSAVEDFSRMSIGTAVDAQFVIVDPGPSATGFELELCAKNARGFFCESDTNVR
jgi:predicted Zn finger-like uncharacterized protein